MQLVRRDGGPYVPARPSPFLGDPWHPTGTVVVPSGSQGTANALSFRPPTQGSAIVISAIKFQITPDVMTALAVALAPVNASFALGQAPQWGHAVAVSFALAKYNQSVGSPTDGTDPTSGDVPAFGAFSGRVPIATLCDCRNVLAELLAGGFCAAGDASVFTGVNSYSEYRWELPRPFYVPPGYIFLPQFFGLSGNIGGQTGAAASAGTTKPVPTLRVQVSYEATLLDPTRYGLDSDYTEDVLRMPFAAAWIAPFSDPADPKGYAAQSDETQLVNTFDDPAYLTRFNGRLLTQRNYSDAAIDAGNALAVRMVAGNHLPIVRDFVAFREVFDRQARSWALWDAAPYALAPGESIIANLTGTNTPPANAGALNLPVQPIIVVSGFRELPLSAFM